jgi:acylphosphatase
MRSSIAADRIPFLRRALGFAAMLERRRVVAHGHVQGVFFRDSVRREAESRGVAGWVRNCDDGTVEAVFEGTEADVRHMIGYCRSDPGSSRVDRIEVVSEEPDELSGFSVR